MTSILAVHLASVENILKQPSFGISNQNSMFSDDSDARLIVKPKYIRDPSQGRRGRHRSSLPYHWSEAQVFTTST